MLYYRKRKTRRWPAWIIAFALFMLVMCLSFADVYGAAYNNYNPPRNNSEYNLQELRDGTMNFDMNNSTGYEIPTASIVEPEVPPVPEPATLTLLGLGFGALLLRRRLKK